MGGGMPSAGEMVTGPVAPISCRFGSGRGGGVSELPRDSRRESFGPRNRDVARDRGDVSLGTKDAAEAENRSRRGLMKNEGEPAVGYGMARRSNSRRSHTSPT
jgi:hypothetical protein